VRSTWKLIALLSIACSSCTYDNVETESQALEFDGLNGQMLNGRGLNGSHLGNALQWASFAKVKIGHKKLDEVWLVGSELVGVKHHGGIVRGTAFVGATFNGRSDTHKHVNLRVADVVAPGAGSDIWKYSIEFRFGSRWIPLCLADALTGDGLNGPLINGQNLNDGIANGDIIVLGSIPVDGYWNYQSGTSNGGSKIASTDRFTFACPKIGAIGKCVEAGFEPWGFDSVGNALDTEHEACVRMMRADYCGNGTPHTVDGTLINAYDALGVQDDTETWPLEAEWDADGARCVTQHYRAASPVACAQQLFDPTCGSPPDWNGGTLLVSETP
jgi:hypothetical protein